MGVARTRRADFPGESRRYAAFGRKGRWRRVRERRSGPEGARGRARKAETAGPEAETAGPEAETAGPEAETAERPGARMRAGGADLPERGCRPVGPGARMWAGGEAE
ncbi:hypothetical protein Q0Z83_072190 [Actinoplanes sichuanensis]|nr:hypothetical protein Q0Z83_072190 [Actinoplanes sichuanensis]